MGPVAQQDTSGGIYGSINLGHDGASTLNGAGLTINGQTYTVIQTVTELAAITGTNDYALAQNLDASSWSAANSGSASVVTTLDGTLAGLGHTVSKLTINTTLQNAGLIGQTTNGSVVRDIGVVGVNIISTSNNVGALIGLNQGDVRGAYSTVSTDPNFNSLLGANTVSASGGVVGGLIGRNNPSSSNTIASSFSDIAVVADNGPNTAGPAGGLIGQSRFNPATIINSHATGKVIDPGGTAGGLVGEAADTNVSGSYATGDVTRGTTPQIDSSTDLNVGGLIGLVESGGADLDRSVSNSFARGNVTGGSALGGLIGDIVSFPNSVSTTFTINNSYATGNVTSSLQSINAGLSQSGIGGLVGILDPVDTQVGPLGAINIRNSFATGTVAYPGSLGNNAGGLVGSVASDGGITLVDNSFANNKVQGSSTGAGAGGLFGETSPGAIFTVSNSSHVGDVSGNRAVGGIAGSTSGLFVGVHEHGNLTCNVLCGSLVGTLPGGAIINSPPDPANPFPPFGFNGGAVVIGSSPQLPSGPSGTGGAGSSNLNGGLVSAALQATSAANVVGSDTQTSALTPPTSDLSAAGTKAVDAFVPPTLDQDLKNIENNIKSEEQKQERRRRRLATTTQHHTGHRSGNPGASIRTIDVDGQRFNLQNGTPKPDTPAQPPH
jgi:hypothetical protein